MSRIYFSKGIIFEAMRKIKIAKFEALSNNSEECLDDWKWDEGFASGLQEALNIIERELVLPPQDMRMSSQICDITISTETRMIENWEDVPLSETSE